MKELRTDSLGYVETKTARLSLPDEGLKLKNGGVLAEVEVAYESYGELSLERDNVVFICPTLTSDAHAAGYHTKSDEKPGWWDDLIGPGKGIDTNYYHVVCANVLGGCQGTTGPSSTDPATGKPYGSSFPSITISDMVQIHKLLLQSFGITRLAAVIGGSLGGMQALDWAIRHPEDVDRCICIASGTSLSAQALAFDHVARDAIFADPDWANGDYYGKDKGPAHGLSHARKIGHITYLSPEIMAQKFGREKALDKPDGKGGHLFQVDSYLNYQGESFVGRFDANSYLKITEAMDTYDLAEEFGGLDKACALVQAKVLVIALSSDWLFPPEQSVDLANGLHAAGRSVSCCTLQAPYGHDAFLIDIAHLVETTRAFLPWVSPRGSGVAKPVKQAYDPTEEHRLICEMVKDGSRVLDLGCGNGDLLTLLKDARQATCMGIDIDLFNVIQTIDKGHDVFQGDLDSGLSVVPDHSYDCAILSSTLQVVRKPRELLREILRVADECIVTFPNFGVLHNRLALGFGGRMPKSEVLPYEWHETPNIRLATLKDFLDLCKQEGIDVLEKVCLPAMGPVEKLLVGMKCYNLGAERILVRIASSAR